MPEYSVHTMTGETILVSLRHDSIGQDLLDKALVFMPKAAEVFGINIKLPNGDHRWLNLRKKLREELKNYSNLTLKVKFYIHPGQLQVKARPYFFCQVLQDLRGGQLKPSSPKQATQLVALIAHAQNGPINGRGSNVDDITTCCKSLMPEPEIPQDVLKRIPDLCNMSDLSRQAAQLKVLEIASTLPLYGFEKYETGKKSGIIEVWIGPSGLKMVFDRQERNESIPFSAIMRIDVDSCILEILICQDGGSPRCLKVRMRTSEVANAAYRSLAEMRTFYLEDEVPEAVRDMTEQSLVGVVVTLLKSNSQYGKTFVFDVNTTLRQMSEHTLRSQHTMRVADNVRNAFSRGRM